MTRFENVGVLVHGERFGSKIFSSERICMDVWAWTGALEHCGGGERLNFITGALSAGSILQTGVVMNCDSCTAVHTILYTL
jgi:hypothetical protein